MKDVRIAKSCSARVYSIALLFFSLAATSALAIYRPSFQRNYDTQHIQLHLKIDHHQRSLLGKTKITIVPLHHHLTSLAFHAVDLEIYSVSLADQIALHFTSDSETVAITFPHPIGIEDTITITIDYFARPKKGLYFNAPSAEKPNVPQQIYSHSEPIDARYWFPCYDEPDDKMTSEVIATVADSFFVLSNGRLVGVKHNPQDHTLTYHWLQDKPHVSYLVSIVAGVYSEIRENSKQVPLYYYVYPGQESLATNSFGKTQKMIEFFERKFGHPYPWDKYAQIIIARYAAAGMEHTSATSFDDRIIHDDRAHLDDNNDDLVAHELAHQWFGNLVTCHDWSHLWLQEGMATYAEILFKEFDAGNDEAQFAIYNDEQFYFEMIDKKFHQPIVFDAYLHPEEMFNYIEYQKAGLVLHMLRYTIGDSSFFSSLKTYLDRFKFQTAVTADFQSVVEQVSGQKLDWFFDQWCYHGGHPKLKISSAWLPERKQLQLYVTQQQSDSLGLIPVVFKAPVDVEIIGDRGRQTHRIFLEAREDTFSFSFRERPVLIRFDTANYLLKEVTFIKSQQEWIYQLLNDRHVAARLEALKALEKATFDTLQTITTVTHCLLCDPFWAVRKQAALFLIDHIKPHGDRFKSALISACADPHPQVRSAAVAALGFYYDRALNPVLRRIADQDASYKVVAEAIYSLSNVPDDSSFFLFSKLVDMESHNQSVRSAALHALRQLKDERAIPIAIRFAADRSQNEDIRLNAISMLKELGGTDPQAEAVIIQLLNDPNNFIKKKAIDALGQFRSSKALAALKQLAEQPLPDDIRRRVKNAIEKIEWHMKN
ncbi:MAG: M1 family aminopeptidase [candidate division KSB1 bacterium]|nr:M1 family aminopeptidase [candidate division KSB1 bacterium]